jgi:hypothetical protein
MKSSKFDIKYYRNLLLIFCLIQTSFSYAQNGHYTSDYNYWWETTDNARFTSDNPQITKSNYLIDINISEFSDVGEVIIKDLDNNTTVIHKVTGKVKSIFDSNTNQYSHVYYAELQYMGVSQLETLQLHVNASSGKLNAILTTSLKFNSKSSYVGIKKISK